MDRIERLLKEIKEDKSVWEDDKGRYHKFSSKFLNDVGAIFEQHGFGVTRVFLINQTGRDRSQAYALLHVLRKLESYQEIKVNRAIGRYIIKTLDTLARMEG